MTEEPSEQTVEVAAKAMWANDRTWETIDPTNRAIQISLAFAAIKALHDAGLIVYRDELDGDQLGDEDAAASPEPADVPEQEQPADTQEGT